MKIGGNRGSSDRGSQSQGRNDGRESHLEKDYGIDKDRRGRSILWRRLSLGDLPPYIHQGILSMCLGLGPDLAMRSVPSANSLLLSTVIAFISRLKWGAQSFWLAEWLQRRLIGKWLVTSAHSVWISEKRFCRPCSGAGSGSCRLLHTTTDLLLFHRTLYVAGTS